MASQTMYTHILSCQPCNPDPSLGTFMPRMTLGSWLWERAWVQRAVVTYKHQLTLEPILWPAHRVVWAVRCAVVASLWSSGCCHGHQRLILGITKGSRGCWHFPKEWGKSKNKRCAVGSVTVWPCSEWPGERHIPREAEPATTAELGNFCTCHDTMLKWHWSILKITSSCGEIP